jgi:activator of HSP90 ATPase
MEYKSLVKHYKFKCEPEDMYAAITNPFTLELWTGYPAQVSTEPGSEFSMWDGDICGRMVSCEENVSVVQEWYFGDQEEKSIVTYKITKDKGNTRLKITHENIPQDAFDEINEGWDDNFGEPLKQFFNADL